MSFTTCRSPLPTTKSSRWSALTVPARRRCCAQFPASCAPAAALPLLARHSLACPRTKYVAQGIAHVPEGRQLFADLTVLENLTIGAPRRLPAAEVLRRLEKVWAMFPRLAARQSQYAGTLSGGEQQMAAIGRALMLGPKLLMLRRTFARAVARDGCQYF